MLNAPLARLAHRNTDRDGLVPSSRSCCPQWPCSHRHTLRCAMASLSHHVAMVRHCTATVLGESPLLPPSVSYIAATNAHALAILAYALDDAKPWMECLGFLARRPPVGFEILGAHGGTREDRVQPQAQPLVNDEREALKDVRHRFLDSQVIESQQRDISDHFEQLLAVLGKQCSSQSLHQIRDQHKERELPSLDKRFECADGEACLATS